MTLHHRFAFGKRGPKPKTRLWPAALLAAVLMTGAAAAPTQTPAASVDWLILVNAQNPLPQPYPVQTALADPDTGKELQQQAAQDYQAMKQAAALEGVQLRLCSGYRSVEYQKGLFEKKLAQMQAKGLSGQQAYDRAATIVAPPGCSEHNTGLAADIVTPEHQALDEAFANTSAFAWLSAHAAEYGFILRYPQGKQESTGIIYEPWHYRYVGPQNAKNIQSSGLCLEEYLSQQ